MRSKKTSKNDILRKLIHITFGLALSSTYYFGFLPASGFLIVLIFGITLSLFIKTGAKLPLIHYILREIDKDDYFPAHGVIFFMTGFVITAVLSETLGLPREYVVVPTLITALGDPASYFIGRGTGKMYFTKDKNLEGVIGGMLVAFLPTLLFMPPLKGLIVAVLAMLPDIPDIKIGSIEVDDNLLIPVTAFIVMTLLR